MTSLNEPSSPEVEINISEEKPLIEIDAQVTITPTFYEQLSCMKVFRGSIMSHAGYELVLS